VCKLNEKRERKTMSTVANRSYRGRALRLCVGLAAAALALSVQAQTPVPTKPANPNAFTCSAEDRVLANSIRPGSLQECAKAGQMTGFELVCQDSGLKFGCCRSACDCAFTAQAFGNKGWGSGGRAYKPYSIGSGCPRPPTAPYPGTTAPPVVQ
jgi:hypothetical protein